MPTPTCITPLIRRATPATTHGTHALATTKRPPTTNPQAATATEYTLPPEDDEPERTPRNRAWRWFDAGEWR